MAFKMSEAARNYMSVVHPRVTRCRAVGTIESGDGKGFLVESSHVLYSPREEVYIRSSATHVLGPDLRAIASTSFHESADVRRICYSPSGRLKAVVRDVAKPGEAKTRTFLEIWLEELGKPREVFDLTGRRVHGAIYADERLGGMAFSKDEKFLFYVAEKERVLAEPYFADCKEDKGVSESGEREEEARSREPRGSFVQSWGEKLETICESVLVVVNPDTASIQVVPDTVFGRGMLPGEFVVWEGGLKPCSGPAVVGVAYDTNPHKLGSSFCLNRRNRIFVLRMQGDSLEKGAFDIEWVQGLEGLCVRGLRMHPEGSSVVFVAESEGGSHAKTGSIHVLDLETGQADVIVPVCSRFLEDANFAGVYGPSPLPERCFAKGSRCKEDPGVFVLFTSTCILGNQIYAVGVSGAERGRVRCLTGECPASDTGSWNLFDVDFDTGLLLAQWSSSSMPGEIRASLWACDGGKEQWTKVSGSGSCFMPWRLGLAEIHRLFLFPDGLDGRYEFLESSALLVLPGHDRGKGSTPLVSIPHGGPHSTHVDEYSDLSGALVASGFAVLKMNFRGSLGCGEDFVRALPGRIGTLDVADCRRLILKALREFDVLDAGRVAVLGGSHGGFLACHLAGQCPDLVHGCIALNPVTDLPGMATATDIPDWVFSEAGLEYGFTRLPLEASDFEALRRMSPVAHMNSIACPVLLIVGDNDLRVPPSQSYSFYYAMKAREKDIEMYHWKDNHGLSKANVVCDVVVTILSWLKRRLGAE